MDHELSKGVRAGVVAYLLWGLLTIYWKQLSDLDAFELVGWRIAMAAVVMAFVVTVRRRWPVLRAAWADRRLTLRVGLAAVLLTINWTTYVWAVSDERILETALGYFLAPLGTMAIGVFVLGERLTPLKQVAVGFAIAAVVVVTVSYGRIPWVALLIAVSWSIYGLTKRQVPLTAIESLAGETFVLLPLALAVIGWGATQPDGVPSSASIAEGVLVAGTGIATAVPLLLFAIAAQRVPFTLLGPLNYLVPLINFLLGWLAYGEDLPPSRFVGFSLVWLALVAVTVDTVRANRRVPRVPVPAAP